MSNESKTLVKKVTDPKQLKEMRERILKDNPDLRNKNTKAPELDSYNNLIDKVSKSIMGPLGSVSGKSIKGILGAAPSQKKLMRRLGASPGKVKAVTGEAMSRGGEVDVVDLTTEMEVNE